MSDIFCIIENLIEINIISLTLPEFRTLAGF